MNAAHPEKPRRFVVDAMLKNIASWLRILGYDSIYWNGADQEILKLAREDDRVILTMDKELASTARRRGLNVLLLKENNVSEILAQIAFKLGLNLDFSPSSTRCPVCNHQLILVNQAEREEWICPGCGKKYWKGSHWRNISKTLNEARRKLKGFLRGQRALKYRR